MNLRSVAVLGGGPGGLYAARLLALHHPGCRVDLYEQSQPDQTFGFGVGLATRTQRNLAAADPPTLRAIVQAAWTHEMAMAVGDHRVQIPVESLIAIGRSRLLDVLREHAQAAGVRLHDGDRVEATALDADLIIAADGVGSLTREAHRHAFGPRVDTHDSLYLWCGTDFALPSAVFAPVTTEFGTFVAHAYPYAADRSTFLVETDPTTWRRAGFDLSTERTPASENDDESLAYLSSAFAGHLHGHRLIGNRTRWLRFRTITCARWHHGNIVLLGDAAHTAHYSIGSGTKLAMEDGIALTDALDTAPDLDTALVQYQTQRRPAVEHLQETARRSMRWWDTFPERLDQPVEQLFIAYMTRAGKVSVDGFAALAPEVVTRGLSHYAACPTSAVAVSDRADWILSRPLVGREHSYPSRIVTSGASGPVAFPVTLDDPWGSDGDDALKTVADAVRDRLEPGVVLTAADDKGALLTMFDLGERLRRELGVLVTARLLRRWTELSADALASGRIDLVEFV